MLIEIFDRWIVRQKIKFLEGELAHIQDDTKRRVLEEELSAEQKTLEKAPAHEQEKK